ncbi:Adenylate and Guanylate cyclase catalytic domain containing protein [Tritrichomonas foetus]|uniref:Adenylate and Guanylate cyclase catalytic domain containing protein n=1 Tax=Tritrichomonas foetus TaxID=1144522 RepID=A0A1J4JQ16_9EUKA|nr:Adenylate and Guanylate cyclase catalytic domain containing protein [Tritrichomonas foetus]|eukprot:OHS99621.1 Adenylate and Guanylate cyclase catalytic domain containing protein [Tritrichomonas foetus]
MIFSIAHKKIQYNTNNSLQKKNSTFIEKMEASVSRSVSSIGSKNAASNFETNSAISVLFPLFDYLTQNIHLPSFLYWLTIAFSGFQVILVTLWIPSNEVWANNRFTTEFMNYYQAIFCFSPLGTSNNELIFTFLFYTIIFAILLSSLIYQIMFYKAKRRFQKWTLYPTRILIEIVPLLMLAPLALLTGRLFRKMVTKNSPFYLYILFIISFVYYIFFALVFNISFGFIFKSIYLPISPLAAFNGGPFVRLIFLSSLYLLLSNALSIFPKWIFFFLIPLHFLPGILLLNTFMHRPFLKKFPSIWSLSIISVCELFDIFQIVLKFVPNLNGALALIISGILLVVTIIVDFIYYFSSRKKYFKLTGQIVEQLADLDENHNNDESKFAIFESFEIAKTETTAQMFIEFAVSEHIYQLIDFPMIKYLYQCHYTTTMLISCLRILAFFPCYTSYLNYLFPDLISKRDLGTNEKFFVYQIKKLKIQRTSASSSACDENLKELNQMRKEIESNLTFFWDQTTYPAKNLPRITSKIAKLESLFIESLSDFTNSLQHFTDYEHFLIECKCDYNRAIVMHHKRSLAESGNIFKVDRCFANFIKNYPEYLILKIVSVNGRFIVKNEKKGSQSSNNIGSHGHSSGSRLRASSNTSSSNLDVAVEESIGKQLFPQSRIRIALQRALASKKATMHKVMSLTGLIVLLTSFVLACAIYFYYRTFMDLRDNTRQRIDNILKIRFYLFTTSFLLLTHHGANAGKIILDLTIPDPDPPFPSFIPDYNQLLQLSLNCSVEARIAYEKFTQSVANYAAINRNVRDFAEALFENKAQVSLCRKDDGFVAYQSYDIAMMIGYISFAQATLMKLTDVSQLLSDNSFCVVMNSSGKFVKPFQDLPETMTREIDNKYQFKQKQVELVRNILPFVYFVVGIPLVIVPFLLYIREIQNVVNMIIALPSKVKKESKEILFKLTDESKPQASEDKSSDAIYWAMIFFILACVAAIAILVFIDLNDVVNANILFSDTAFWSKSSQVRKSTIVETLFWLYSTIIFGSSTNTVNFININNTKKLAQDAITTMFMATAEVMSDTASSKSLVGNFDFIDSLLLTPWCETNTEFNDQELHETYRCASSQQLLSLFKTMISDTLNNIDKYNGIVEGNFLSQSSHMVFEHIIPLLLAIDESFDTVSQMNIQNVHADFDTTFPIMIILIIISLAVYSILLKLMDNVYKVVLMLISRIHPQAVLASPELVKYLFNKTGEDNIGVMSMHQRIMHSSNDAIICCDYKGVIEIVNPAVSSTFGYTPDQLLGQSLLILLSENNRLAIDQQMNLMRHKQSAMTYEDNIECMTDDDTILLCSITILAMNDNKGDISSFVIILRDESILQSQQKEAEEAKKASEKLLYQILPRGIVFRLNQGEKDISFTVPSSTIMFVDIVKFSEYASTLTPQEIMCNLSYVFSTFDTTIPHYDELIKIKLIGDVYMAAGGLFNENVQPQVHAEQMVKFGLDCLQLIEEANLKLNANLSVRIGVNTGGPLIAGVLGSDRPTFDIIGDPINIAARLQSTDIAGRIQISQNVFDLINGMDFVIEKRGEIMLKGKGKTMTYLVSSFRAQGGLSAESSNEIDFVISSMRSTD